MAKEERKEWSERRFSMGVLQNWKREMVEEVKETGKKGTYVEVTPERSRASRRKRSGSNTRILPSLVAQNMATMG